MRSRLLMLVGLLVFVFLLMGEARKPENYHWLTKLQGGGEASKAPSQPRPRPARVDSKTGTKILDITDSLPDRPLSRPTPAAPRVRREQAEGMPNQELSAGPLGNLSEVRTTTEAKVSPWRELLNGLGGDERTTLFRLLQADNPVASPDALPQSPLSEQATSFVGKLNSQVNDLFATQLDRTSSDRSAEERDRQTAAVIEFKSKWDANVFPAFQAAVAGNPLTPEQAVAIRSAREEIFRQSLALIQDATEVARPADALAWLLAWNQLLRAPLGGTTPVTPYELLTQPKQYRGRAVSFSGTLRGIETATANEQELGISQYYVLWIQPKELDRTPYCVYAAELPAELRPNEGRFENTKQPLTVRGMFWKVRTYVDTTKAIATCPLVLARNVVLTTAPVAAEPYRWKPPAWVLWTISLLLPFVALGIAWRIYQTGKEFAPPRSPGRTRMILDSLEELGADSSIQSARESLARLETPPDQPAEER